jgi:hypothetical protein
MRTTIRTIKKIEVIPLFSIENIFVTDTRFAEISGKDFNMAIIPKFSQ